MSVPKKPKKNSPLTVVREGMGLSQPEFARRLGISASMVKKLEEGKRPISQDLVARIFAETGVFFSNAELPDGDFSYTKEDHANWTKETQFNDRAAVVASRLVLKLVELMLIAAARPGARKSYQVWNAIIQSLEGLKREFKLEKHIEAELRERNSTETKLYTVRELRDNDLLASMVNFKDSPDFKDDDKLPLSKTTGWFPVKEAFNIAWCHRQLLKEFLQTPETELTEEAKAKFEAAAAQIEKEMDAEADRFLGALI